MAHVAPTIIWSLSKPGWTSNSYVGVGPTSGTGAVPASNAKLSSGCGVPAGSAGRNSSAGTDPGMRSFAATTESNPLNALDPFSTCWTVIGWSSLPAGTYSFRSVKKSIWDAS